MQILKIFIKLEADFKLSIKGDCLHSLLELILLKIFKFGFAKA